MNESYFVIWDKEHKKYITTIYDVNTKELRIIDNFIGTLEGTIHYNTYNNANKTIRELKKGNLEIRLIREVPEPSKNKIYYRILGSGLGGSIINDERDSKGVGVFHIFTGDIFVEVIEIEHIADISKKSKEEIPESLQEIIDSPTLTMEPKEPGRIYLISGANDNDLIVRKSNDSAYYIHVETGCKIYKSSNPRKTYIEINEKLECEAYNALYTKVFERVMEKYFERQSNDNMSCNDYLMNLWQDELKQLEKE